MQHFLEKIALGDLKMVFVALEQLVRDITRLWVGDSRGALILFFLLFVGLLAIYHFGLVVMKRWMANAPALRYDLMAIALRAVLFGAGWLVVMAAEPHIAAWEDPARRFLWVFLIVGLAGYSVSKLPWPAPFKRQSVALLVIGGYGGFWLVPGMLSYSEQLGWLLNAAVIIALMGIASRVIWQQRQTARGLLLNVRRAQFGFVVAMLLHAIAPVWHWFALSIVLATGLASLSMGPGVAGFLGLAILKTAAFLGLAILVSRGTEALANRGVRLPAPACDRYPALESRVSVWGPLLLRSVHFLIAAAFIAALLDAWAVVDVVGAIRSPLGGSMLGGILSILFVLFLTALAWLLVMSWIEDRLNPDIGQGAPTAREKTLLTLFRSAAGITIIVMATMVLLAEFGINIGPLIAGAGVVGLAVGFGAQTLVQDIITGIFIQIEDAIHADDYITVAGMSGTVERLSLRSLALRDLTGTLHIIPFSSVNLVSNFTRDFGYHLGVYGVAYRENIGEVIEQLQVAYDRLISNGDIASAVAGPLEVDGVTALDNSSVNIRVRIRTTPGMQWAVGRAFNRVVKETFDEAGIEIPFPHMTLWFGEDKKGEAPAAPLRIVKEE